MPPQDLSAPRPLPQGKAAEPAVEHVVQLRVELAARVALEHIPRAFAPDARWLGEPTTGAEHGTTPRPGWSAFVCDLELQAGGRGPTLFRKAAIVAFGEPRREGAGWIVPIEWRASTLAPLFPVFAGHLHLVADRIELLGSYAPPGGTLGSILDAALLRAAARQTARWFLRELASALA